MNILIETNFTSVFFSWFLYIETTLSTYIKNWLIGFYVMKSLTNVNVYLILTIEDYMFRVPSWGMVFNVLSYLFSALWVLIFDRQNYFCHYVHLTQFYCFIASVPYSNSSLASFNIFIQFLRQISDTLISLNSFKIIFKILLFPKMLMLVILFTIKLNAQINIFNTVILT